MNQDGFKAKYPSVKFSATGKTLTLSSEDLAALHKEIGTAAPENVKTFFYHGYQIEEAPTTPAAKSSQVG